ncbi:MAG TPA: LacI family DNA-binding transcriptional regulator [Terriglobales bacterium]|nr:LacI family DNA-binding transcriptional regulator [Terriglobales bacterium]
MNIKAVAAKAGVSIATVSRTINGHASVTPETAENVLRAIRALGYYPNRQARTLASGRSHTFGLIISDIANPFFPELVKSFETTALSHNYDVTVFNTSYDSHRLRTSIERMLERRVDGVAVMTSEFDRRVLGELSRRGVPIVFLDVGTVQSRISNILVDYEKGIREAVQHVSELGHQKIAFISGPLQLKSAGIRWRAMQKCMHDCGLQIPSRFMREANHRVDGGQIAMADLLNQKDPPTAVLASNDLTAIGAMKAIYRKGLRVPDDLSIIGFDDIELCEFMNPPLTTVRLSREEIGRHACGALLKVVEEGEIQGQELSVSTELVLRGSTAPLETRKKSKRTAPNQ